MKTTLMFRPLDILHLRGNRLFGGPGDHGEPLMPPWPSVFTGAVVSRAIADAGRLAEAAEKKNGPELIGELFGGLTLRWTALADENGHDRLFFPPPADVVVLGGDDGPEPHSLAIEPRDRFEGCASSMDEALPALPVLRTGKAAKPEGGCWLSFEGLKAHLAGRPIECGHLKSVAELWKTDPRLGIALDGRTRTAEKGRIYTTEAVALSGNIGFVCAFEHARGELPSAGLVRLGGDGRGAEILAYPEVEDFGRPGPGMSAFRMILASPCPSPTGWIPPGVERKDGALILRSGGLEARLTAAAVSRHEVVSGWDLAKHRPKAAERMIPAGSVYWFEVTKGDTESLTSLWEEGILFEDKDYAGRRREGFGRVWFGTA